MLIGPELLIFQVIWKIYNVLRHISSLNLNFLWNLKYFTTYESHSWNTTFLTDD